MFNIKIFLRASRWLGLSFLLVPILANPAYADKVVFGDGNILYGTVTSMENGVLVFSNSFSKNVQIPVADIKFITTDNPVKIKLTNDSILNGPLMMTDDGKVGVKLDLVGTVIPFEWSRVKNINEPEGSWTGRIAIGGNVNTGNTENHAFIVDGQAKREWEHDRLALRFLYNYKDEDDTITTRNVYGSLKFDHFFTEDFYGLVSMEFLIDEFKDINLRAITGVGLGYRFWNDAVKTLDLEAGVTLVSEDLDVGPSDQYIAGRLAGYFTYKFTDNLQFTDNALYYPSFEDLSKFTARNEASLISLLGYGWSLRLSYIYEFDSNPAPGILTTDQQFIFALQYDF